MESLRTEMSCCKTRENTLKFNKLERITEEAMDTFKSVVNADQLTDWTHQNIPPQEDKNLQIYQKVMGEEVSNKGWKLFEGHPIAIDAVTGSEAARQKHYQER